MVTYQLDLGPTASNSTVVCIREDGTERDISGELRGVDVHAEVGSLTLLTLHGFGRVRATLADPKVRWLHDDCSDCQGHDEFT